MKKSLATVTLAALIASWPLTATADGGKVRYQIQVFRLTGGFEHDTSDVQAIWAGNPADWEKIADEVTLFDDGEFHIESDRLSISRRGCYWNDQKLTFEEGIQVPLPEDRIKLIYSPIMLRRQGELVRMKIESRQPFQFMERRSDGHFELKELSLPVGMDIEIKAEQPERNVFLISCLELELRTVNRRETALGTRLPVGRPVLDEHEYKLRLRVHESKNYGILLKPMGSSGAIIIRIEIDDR